MEEQDHEPEVGPGASVAFSIDTGWGSSCMLSGPIPSSPSPSASSSSSSSPYSSWASLSESLRPSSGYGIGVFERKKSSDDSGSVFFRADFHPCLKPLLYTIRNFVLASSIAVSYPNAFPSAFPSFFPSIRACSIEAMHSDSNFHTFSFSSVSSTSIFFLFSTLALAWSSALYEKWHKFLFLTP